MREMNLPEKKTVGHFFKFQLCEEEGKKGEEGSERLVWGAAGGSPAAPVA